MVLGTCPHQAAVYTLGHENITPKVLDTGASMNAFDESAFTCLNQAQGIKLSHSSARLMAYGSKSQLEISGKFTATIEAGGKSTTTTIYMW